MSGTEIVSSDARLEAVEPTDSVFFSLPINLWNAIESEIGTDLISEIDRQREIRMAMQNGSHDQSVGSWRSGKIPYVDLVEPTPFPEITREQCEQLGWDMNMARISRNIAVGSARSSYFSKVGRAYCGWLLSTRLFLDEQDELLSRHRSAIERWGLRGAGQVFVAMGKASRSEGAGEPMEATAQRYHGAVRNFLIRWRLLELPAPNLPVPMKPAMAGFFPVSVLQQLMDSGGLFNLPDTFPIPSRDELRGILVDALRDREAPHLAEWHAIIRANNPAKNKIDRYARLRTFIHFWRALNQRHTGLFRRNKERLRNAFARYLGVDSSTIKADLAFLKGRLGSDWESRRTLFVAEAE